MTEKAAGHGPPARRADATQARLLLDPRLRPLLQALARAGETNAAELARGLHKPLSSVHAQLERLLQAGVLEGAGRRLRAGRPVRLYRLPLPWVIPFEVTPAATRREVLDGFEHSLRHQLDALARLMERGEGHVETVLEWNNNQLEDNIHVRRGDPAANPLARIIGASHELRLTPGRQAELYARLQALLQEFRADQTEAGEPWSLSVLLTPVAP